MILPMAQQKNLNDQRATLMRAIEVFSKGTATLAEAGINPIHTNCFGGMLQKQPGTNHAPRTYKLIATADVVIKHINQLMEQKAAHALEKYKQKLEANRISRMDIDDEDEPATPPADSSGFRKVELFNANHWARSNTYAMPRCHGSLGGNSIAYYG